MASGFKVQRDQNGMPLQDFLAEQLGLSRRKAKERIDTRGVFVNRKRTWMARHTLRTGDLVEWIDETPRRSASTIDVLYEDADYVIVNKPAGQLSNGDDSVELLLRHRLNIPTLRAVHRLDRDTSGCLILARSDRAFEAMLPLFRDRVIHKTYHAIVHGRMPSETTIRRPIEGQDAVTRVRVIQSNAQASHLSLHIETGRTHQIRKHLAGLHHGVIGDSHYVAGQRWDEGMPAIKRQMLHASQVDFPHPASGRPVRAHAPLPTDFRACLRAFRLD